MARIQTFALRGSLLLAALLVTAVVPMTASGLNEPKKDTCTWQMNGVAWPVAPVFPAGTAVATQILTLTCPNHIELGEPQYGYKFCRGFTQECVAPVGDIQVTDLGRVDEPKIYDPTGKPPQCSWTRSWEVTSPSANLYAFWFRVHTFKDADCDKKPDDWNHERFEPLQDKADPNIWRQSNTIPPYVYNYGDGSLDGNPCYWHNTYYDGRTIGKPPAGGGNFDPRAPGYFPVPDGEVNECDWQTYEWQWFQWN